MKVEIVTDAKTETIDFDGNTIMPYYISVLSIRHHPDKIVIRMLDKYQTKLTTGAGQESCLWIMGIGKKPVNDGGEEQRIM
jgi:hypothetical protein